MLISLPPAQPHHQRKLRFPVLPSLPIDHQFDKVSMEVPPIVIAAVAGFVAHCILSPISEVPTIPFLNATGLSEALLLAYLVRSRQPLFEIILLFLLFNTTFWTVLIAVTLFRRLYIHPLRKYPGKKVAALSKFYEAYLNFNGHQGLELKELHQKHGIIIRTGPNEISINDVDALQLLHRKPYVNRGPFYEIAAIMGDFTVFTVRDNNLHKQWRGIWEQAFKTKSLKDYEPRVEKHVQRFVEALDSKSGETIDITESTAKMAFDIMADLGFGIDHSVKGAQGDNSYMVRCARFSPPTSLTQSRTSSTATFASTSPCPPSPTSGPFSLTSRKTPPARTSKQTA